MGNMPYQPEEVAAQILQGFFIFGLVFAAVIAVVFYIFTAISLYTISKKRGYSKAWIAFIPVANWYLMGAIADNINLTINKKTGFRYLLLFFGGVSSIVDIAKIPSSFKIIEKFSLYIDNPAGAINSMKSTNLLTAFSGLLGLGLLIVLGFVLYRIYMDYSPNTAVVFLVLSLLFRIYPFFLFAIRNKQSASMFYAQQQQQQQQPQQYYQTPFPEEQQNNNNDNNDGTNQF